MIPPTVCPRLDLFTPVTPGSQFKEMKTNISAFHALTPNLIWARLRANPFDAKLNLDVINLVASARAWLLKYD